MIFEKLPDNFETTAEEGDYLVKLVDEDSGAFAGFITIGVRDLETGREIFDLDADVYGTLMNFDFSSRRNMKYYIARIPSTHAI